MRKVKSKYVRKVNPSIDFLMEDGLSKTINLNNNEVHSSVLTGFAQHTQLPAYGQYIK